MSTLRAVTLQPHPLCAEVPGEMSDAEFQALTIDIGKNGLREAITLFEGKILDGRARYAACLRCGIAPRFDEVPATTQKPESAHAVARAYVVSKNLHRRTLNAMQKAIVGARQCANGAQHREVCTLLGIGAATLQTAIKLLKSNNTPLIRDAEMGRLTCPEVEEALWSFPKAKQQDRKFTADKAVDTFKHLDNAARKAFVEKCWDELEPALVEAGKIGKRRKAA